MTVREAPRGGRQDLPIKLLALAEARDFIGLEETEGPNRGPGVEFFQSHARIPPGSPWCAAFVNGVVHTASAKHNVRSLLEEIPRQGYVQDYADWADANGRLLGTGQVEPGDLFALYFGEPKNRFAHIGFVYDRPRDGQFSTIEGNTDDEASREGVKVASRIRPLTDGTIFFDWTWETP